MIHLCLKPRSMKDLTVERIVRGYCHEPVWTDSSHNCALMSNCHWHLSPLCTDVVWYLGTSLAHSVESKENQRVSFQDCDSWDISCLLSRPLYWRNDWTWTCLCFLCNRSLYLIDLVCLCTCALQVPCNWITSGMFQNWKHLTFCKISIVMWLSWFCRTCECFLRIFLIKAEISIHMFLVSITRYWIFTFLNEILCWLNAIERRTGKTNLSGNRLIITVCSFEKYLWISGVF